MDRMTGDFFGLESYVIDERLSVFKFTNAYKVYDTLGAQIGTVEQRRVSAAQKVLRLLFGNSMKMLFGFVLEIKDNDGNPLMSLSRSGLKGGAAMRTVRLLDPQGGELASIRLLFSLWTPKLDILDVAGNPVARIEGDWKGWNFSITDMNGAQIGTVNKKWNGVAKEVFTTADKYHVTVLPQAGAGRAAVVATAIVLDMLLKEFK
jgi:uncharacterized protein YxjI